MDDREAFYRRVVSEWIPDRESRVLVCGGGELDRRVFVELGYTQVTISNLDERMDGASYAPLAWAEANAEQLPFPDEAFDYCVIHAAVHHASSPHRVLTEMYRVARTAFIAFEARDSWVMRRMEQWGLTQVYEHAAVHFNDGRYGGVNNSEIPNYVYRWTEREVEKTIRTYAPHVRHRFAYRYATAFPATPANERAGGAKHLLIRVARPFFRVATWVAPRQQNLFAFQVAKGRVPEDLHPWLEFREGRVCFNKQWGAARYKATVQDAEG